MSNKYTSVYDWLKYIKANVVGINLRELRITILQYNCDFNMESSELGEELMAHSGEREPQFVKENIVEGFTYTKQDGVRIDGLVTRRNNELITPKTSTPSS